MNITQLGFYEGQTPFESPNTMHVLSTSKFNPIKKRIACGTGDSFVDDIKKESLYVQVFDMEAYALAKVCRDYNVPFISFKYITDNADKHSAKNWEENCSDGVQLFKSEVLSNIKW
jgi:adenosylhomocysteine nucleosidase